MQEKFKFWKNTQCNLYSSLFYQDSTRVISPVIDIINMETFKYLAASSELRGGFDWSMHFKWERLSEEEIANRIDPVSPIKYLLKIVILYKIFLYAVFIKY